MYIYIPNLYVYIYRYIMEIVGFLLDSQGLDKCHPDSLDRPWKPHSFRSVFQGSGYAWLRYLLIVSQLTPHFKSVIKTTVEHARKKSNAE